MQSPFSYDVENIRKKSNIGMFLMTIGEMIAFPFSNAFAAERAKKGNQGQYMALYSMAFSVAHIFGHNAGLQLAAGIGFDPTWYIMTLLAFSCALLLFLLKHFLKNYRI